MILPARYTQAWFQFKLEAKLYKSTPSLNSKKAHFYKREHQILGHKTRLTWKTWIDTNFELYEKYDMIVMKWNESIHVWN